MLKQKRNNTSLDITHIGDAVLSQKAEPVLDVLSKETQELIDKMFEAMYREKGLGLAAPQVNESKQIITIDVEGEKFVLINPKVTNKSKDMILFTEGCLSVPEKELPIIRHDKITVQYLDRDGKKCILKARELIAIVCQHEIDHINGMLITDRYNQQIPLRETLNITQEV